MFQLIKRVHCSVTLLIKCFIDSMICLHRCSDDNKLEQRYVLPELFHEKKPGIVIHCYHIVTISITVPHPRVRVSECI